MCTRPYEAAAAIVQNKSVRMKENFFSFPVVYNFFFRNQYRVFLQIIKRVRKRARAIITNDFNVNKSRSTCAYVIRQATYLQRAFLRCRTLRARARKRLFYRFFSVFTFYVFDPRSTPTKPSIIDSICVRVVVKRKTIFSIRIVKNENRLKHIKQLWALLTQERIVMASQRGGARFPAAVHEQFGDEHGHAQHYAERQDDERYFEVSNGKHLGRLVIFPIDRFVLVEYVLGHVRVPLDHQPSLVDPRQQRIYPLLERRMSEKHPFCVYPLISRLGNGEPARSDCIVAGRGNKRVLSRTRMMRAPLGNEMQDATGGSSIEELV